MRLTTTCFIALVLMSSCNSDALIPTFAVDFFTEADRGVPLEKVTVSVDGTVVGTSTELGLVQATLRGQSGASVEIVYTCPDGFAPEEPRKTLVLHEFSSASKSNSGVLRTRLRCIPKKRWLAILIDAPGAADLPVAIDGEVVTRTNSKGVAHWTQQGTPGQQVKVEVQVTDPAELRPNNPPGVFEIANKDEIVVYKQSFDVLKKPKPKIVRKKKRKKKRIQRRPRIIRIE